MVKDPSERDSVKVTDKRHFDTDGSPREPSSERPGDRPEDGRPQADGVSGTIVGPDFTAHPAEPSGHGAATPSGGPAAAEELPSVDFATLVLSFRASALVHLGLVKDPAVGAGSVNLEGARQMIDILTILQQKTEGNLTTQEKRLLDEVLSELQLHFVKTSHQQASEE
jgi:hypothetical protein